MNLKNLFPVMLLGAFAFQSCGDQQQQTDADTVPKADTPDIREEGVTYTAGNTEMKGFVFFDRNNKEKRPGVLVVHEWWGLNDYPRNRARQLAEMGYIAFAVDMYGNGQTAANPQEAMKLAGLFYQDPSLTKTRLDAAIQKLKSYEQTDTGKIAAIGYCYGGFVVLNAAKLGADLEGVVSFHGDLSGVPVKKEWLKAKVLICHGESDNFVPQKQVDAFKKSMDSAGISYSFKSYPGATHAFTNPEATENGKKFNMPIAYNAAADSASWKDMKDFFGNIFK